MVACRRGSAETAMIQRARTDKRGLACRFAPAREQRFRIGKGQMITRILLLLPILLLFPPWSTAQEWTRFRGPNGSGLSSANLPVRWTGEDLNWKVKLPGRGHSSPVLWGQRIFVTSGDDKTGLRI